MTIMEGRYPGTHQQAYPVSLMYESLESSEQPSVFLSSQRPQSTT